MARHPTPDRHSRAFWDGLARHEVVVARCRSCGRTFFPHMASCPCCAGASVGQVVVPGTGVVYSWVRVWRALGPDPAVPPPYVVATVELDTGAVPGCPDLGCCRMFGRLVPHEAAAIGLGVGPWFVAHDGWTELAFQPLSPGPEHQGDKE